MQVLKHQSTVLVTKHFVINIQAEEDCLALLCFALLK
jgi:hypothetical protein